MKAPVSIPARESLVDLFQEFAARPDEFLIYDNDYRTWRYTYAQVSGAALHFAARLRAAGIGKGDKAVLWSESRPEWIVAFWGCMLEGVVVVPVDYQSSAAFAVHVQEIVGARLVLIGEEIHGAAFADVPVWPLAELEWSAGAAGPRVPIGKDDVAEIIFTSGATGTPKGVVITHRNILANIASPEAIIVRYRRYFGPLLPLRFLSLIPLSHMFGQVFTLFLLPLIPGTAVFMRGYNPHKILAQIRSRKITAAIAVPKILEVLHEQVLHQFPEAAAAGAGATSVHWWVRWWQHRQIHRSFGWRFWAFIAGGAPLDPELEAFWSKLGFAVIQGYGLTETAPIVAFNNPFSIKQGTVGRPITGMEVTIAPDGEILVRGESVTSGYFEAPAETEQAFREGWFHTGDLGELDATGHLTVHGRKKEVIVTADGRKVFPEDVERTLDQMPGVRESAVVGRDRVHAVLVLDQGADAGTIVNRANAKLEDHQRIKAISVWPGERLPRTEAAQKLKRGQIQQWVDSGGPAPPPAAAKDVVDILRQHAPARTVTRETTLDELGLSSLDRVELMIDLEQHLDTAIDESLLTGSRTAGELASLSSPPVSTKFPEWNRQWWAKAARRIVTFPILLPLTRCFAHLRVSGLEHVEKLHGPVIFAPNHQSHLDTVAVLAALPARHRRRMAVAMWKEYFDAHFSPARHSRTERFVNSLVYYFIALLFNAFPLPQTEARAGESLRYMGELASEGWSLLFFPEGERTETGEIRPFLPGVGFIASRLDLPVVPVRLTGLDKVLHRNAPFPRPGPVHVAFGAPLRLKGDDYAALAAQVQAAVTALPTA
jgi:long-chain acyl-CoA synthetase